MYTLAPKKPSTNKNRHAEQALAGTLSAASPADAAKAQITRENL